MPPIFQIFIDHLDPFFGPSQLHSPFHQLILQFRTFPMMEYLIQRGLADVDISKFG